MRHQGVKLIFRLGASTSEPRFGNVIRTLTGQRKGFEHDLPVSVLDVRPGWDSQHYVQLQRGRKAFLLEEFVQTSNSFMSIKDTVSASFCITVYKRTDL